MGNTVSVPPREPFVNNEATYNTMMRNVNQSRLVGNPDPVKQISEEAILKAASPRGFNLTQATMADRSNMEIKAAECREHKGIGGIRDLDLKIGVRTAYEPGCGWIYKKNGISRGAFGSEGDAASPNNPRAPIFSRVGEKDEVTNGASFYMDFEKIERLVSKDMVNGIKCKDMANVSDVKPYIGYCKTSGRVIPVQRTATGGAIARFKDDVEFKCASDQIILPGNTASCPTGTVSQTSRTLGTEKFKNYESAGSGSQSRGRSIDEAFYQPNWALNNQHATMPQMLNFAREGFTNGRSRGANGSESNSQQFSPNGGFATGAGRQRRSEGFMTPMSASKIQPQPVGISSSDTNFERCAAMGNLGNNSASKQCIIIAARQAGFDDNGSLIKFMSSGFNSTAPAVFENYKRLNPETDFIPSTFTNGTKTINDIINILTLVRMNISNSSDEISRAARDIVSEGGLYEDEYNLCSWIEAPAVDINRINAGDTATEKCLQNFWRNRGGDSRGIEFPTLAKWLGKTIGEFKQSFQLISNDVNSTVMDTQSLAINKKYGVKSYKENVTTKYIQKPKDCEKELVSSTQSSCPAFVSLEQPIPSYTDTYKITKDLVAGGKACKLEETKTCKNTIACEPVNCIGGWTETPCSVICGPGTQEKKYVVTRAAQCGGTQCEVADGTVQSNIECNPKPRECAESDCKYTRQVVIPCPGNLGSLDNCDKTHTRKVNLVPAQNYSSNISRLCPTTPREESCGPVVACPVIPSYPVKYDGQGYCRSPYVERYWNASYIFPGQQYPTRWNISCFKKATENDMYEDYYFPYIPRVFKDGYWQYMSPQMAKEYKLW